MMRLYRLLLYLFPAGFRGEYGEEMCWVFARKQKEASGTAKMLLWLETLYDVAAGALHVHFDILRQDLRYTARTLSRTPGFTLTAILVAALGVGATTAAFSIADHVLIRPLPFREWKSLVKLWESSPGYSRIEVSPPNYRDWKSRSTSFESMGAFWTVSMNLTGHGDPERVEGAAMTSEVIPILGINPLLGRTFTAEDEQNESRSLLISYNYWQTRFRGDGGVLGKKLLLDNEPYVIVGVMPAGFYFPRRELKFWTPLRMSQDDSEDRDNDFLQVIARLKKNISLERAKSEMQVIGANLAREYPEENAQNEVKVLSLRDEVSRQSRFLLFALVGASVCVLLITSANLANLLLARSMARRKEFAVRTALGAGRERLLRQLLTESLILAAIGGVLGIVLAFTTTPLLARLVPNSLPIGESPSLDVRILVSSVIAIAITGIGFGLLPALKMYRRADTSELHSGARNELGMPKERLRTTLIVAEVAMSVLLLISSGLLLRALWKVQSTDPGFRAENVLTLRTWLPLPKYEVTAKRTDFYRRVLEPIRALPGVVEAAYISYLPMVVRGGVSQITIPGRTWSPGEEHLASMRFVTPGYFQAMGIPLKEGRDISESDTQKSPFIAVVSESFVKEYWPGQSPQGRKFHFAFQERTIVGVVGDVLFRGLERQSEPQVYLSYQQVPDASLIYYAPKDLVIQFSGDAAALGSSVRQIIERADPEQPVSDIRLLTDIVGLETVPRGTQLRVIGAFALLAVILAGIGIHGLLSYAVSQRMQEFGVRMALGAKSIEILRLVMREGIMLAVAGILLGSLLAYLSGRTLEALLAGVPPADPATFAVAIGVALFMTLAGCLVPALQAVRTDPAKAIRSE